MSHPHTGLQETLRATNQGAQPPAADVARSECLAQLQELTERVQALEKLFWLAARDVVFFSTYNDAIGDWDDDWHPAVNLNDTFCYACADADAIHPDELDQLIDVYRRFGHDGVTAWAAVKRQAEPIEPRQSVTYHAARHYLSDKARLSPAGEKPMNDDSKRNPPLPFLDEKDHELARMRWIIDELFNHIVHVQYAIETKEMDTAGVVDYLEKKVYPPLNAAAENGAFYHDYAQYKPDRWQRIRAGLKDVHAGDCMCEPFTCMRCYAEGFYGLDTTPLVPGSKTWKGNSDDPD